LNSNLQMRGKIAARYVAKTLKLDSLAILAPADKFGRALVDGFVKEADLLGKKNSSCRMVFRYTYGFETTV
jgi:ABC-type branched-subunit amino acid transport system substrate-binding protein